MKKRSIAIALTLALTFGSLALAGCSGAAPTSGTRSAAADSAGSLSVTAQPAVTSTPDATGAGTSGTGPSASELAAMKKQLDAMQKEIDSLSLPSDGDFSDAANAVY